MKLHNRLFALTFLAVPGVAFAQETVTPVAPATTFAVPMVQIPLPTPPAPPAKVPSGLADIIRAKYPLSIGYDDLGAGWRVLKWNSTDYFTKGENTFVGPTEYLVAYKTTQVSLWSLTPEEYTIYVTQDALPFPTKKMLRFALSLLPMNQVQSYITGGSTDLKSFDPEDYYKAAPSPNTDAFQQNLSIIYLRKIGEALASYSRDNLAVLPPLHTAFAARQSLEPDAENAAIFTQPGTNKPFKFNPILSGRKRAHLKGKNSWVIAYESEPASDGSRGILRLSGSAVRVNNETWLKVKEASKIE